MIRSTTGPLSREADSTGRETEGDAVRLVPTVCAICGAGSPAKELYPADLHSGAFSPSVFSARRAPDRLHYRIVRCRTCGLVRSDPVAQSGLLARLYSESGLNYEAELGNLRRTYGSCLARLERYGAVKGNLLDIGCGNGFVLEEALSQGYRAVCGVEPSRAAAAKASPVIRPHIAVDMLRPGLFRPGEFDVVCMFQVLDHVGDPRGFLEECLRLLRPGGLLLAFNHNVAAWSARVLGQRSPIIDVEHTFLYNPQTMRMLFERCGFEVLKTGTAWNRYALRYLTRLLPLPARWKAGRLAQLLGNSIGRIPVTVPLGNLYQVARRPATGNDSRKSPP
jgi:SAM-dependent methyltransferase